MTFLSPSETEKTLLMPYFFSVFPGDIFAHTRRLEKVDLSRNKLKSLAGVFTDLFGLEEVFLNDNLLLSFSNEWFSNTPNVRTIHLGLNFVLFFSSYT